ncbi:hypothetical protein ACFSUF_03165 [Paenibacillus gansuensis]|uniref:Uncharacterized protein n=1 Tax=Paenibacillus gansuensis TaxID=306542 RepID=A0ABW5PAB7_9BACL
MNKSPLLAVDVIYALIRTYHTLQREFEARIRSLDMAFELPGPRLRPMFMQLKSTKSIPCRRKLPRAYLETFLQNIV